MMYSIAAAVTVPARSSVVKRDPFLSKGCPLFSSLNQTPTFDLFTISAHRCHTLTVYAHLATLSFKRSKKLPMLKAPRAV